MLAKNKARHILLISSIGFGPNTLMDATFGLHPAGQCTPESQGLLMGQRSLRDGIVVSGGWELACRVAVK